MSCLFNERQKKLILADRSVIVLVKVGEVLLELLFVEDAVRLDAMEHLLAEFADLVSIERAIAVGVDTGEEFLSRLHELLLTDGHSIKIIKIIIIIIIIYTCNRG